MRCLQCGKRLPILRKLTDGEFCSANHRKKFHDEQEKLALARLLESRDRIAELTSRPTAADDHEILAIRTPFVSVRPSARSMRPAIRCQLAVEEQWRDVVFPLGVAAQASLLSCWGFLIRGFGPLAWGTPEPWGEISAISFKLEMALPEMNWALYPNFGMAQRLACGVSPARGSELRSHPAAYAARGEWALPILVSPGAPVPGSAALLAVSRPEPSAGSYRHGTEVLPSSTAVRPVTPGSGLRTVFGPLKRPAQIPGFGALISLAPQPARQREGTLQGFPVIASACAVVFPVRNPPALETGFMTGRLASLSIGPAGCATFCEPCLHAQAVAIAAAIPALGLGLIPCVLGQAAALRFVLDHPARPPVARGEVAIAMQADFPATILYPVAPEIPAARRLPAAMEVLPVAPPAPAGEAEPIEARLDALEPSGSFAFPSAEGIAARMEPIPAGEFEPCRVEAASDPQPLVSDAVTVDTAEVGCVFPATERLEARREPDTSSDLISCEVTCPGGIPKPVADPKPVLRPGTSPAVPAAGTQADLAFDTIEEDPEMAGTIALPVPAPRYESSRYGRPAEPMGASDAPYAPAFAVDAGETRLEWARGTAFDLPLGTKSFNTVPVFTGEFLPPGTSPLIPRLGMRPVAPAVPNATDGDGMAVQEAESAFDAPPAGRMDPVRHFWKHAPADLRWLALVLPLAILFGLHQGVKKVRVDAAASGGIGTAVKARWDDVRVGILRRAAIDHQEDFRSGLSSWGGRPNWSREWKYDANGSIRPGPLAIYQPSAGMADYRFEFLGQIERKALSWVYRASDLDNYYVTRIVLTKPGPLPSASIVRYAVIGGKEGPHKQIPLPMQVRPDTMYRVRVDVSGPNFTTFVQGQIVDFWSDSTLMAGGIGFFAGKGESALLRWVEITHQYDMLGRLCAFLAPYSVPRDGSWSQ